MDYVSELSDGWHGHALTPAYGATIATGVIEMLLGKEYSPKSMVVVVVVVVVVVFSH